MPSISLQYHVEGVLTDPVSVWLADAGSAYGIRYAQTGLTAVAPTGPLAPTSVGVYSYDTSTLTGGLYEAVWRVEDPYGVYSYRPQTFSVDAVAPYTGVRLMDVERAVALRCGPYLEITSTDGSTTGLVQSAELTSTIPGGEYSDLYVLRRGRTPEDAAVVGVPSSDRVRQISEVNLALGQLVVDRPWATAPALGEELELHALHPTWELRRAVLAGLKRAFLVDRVSIAPTGAMIEVDLTASAPWITNPAQVRAAEAGPTTAMLPMTLPWTHPYTRGGHVWLKLAGYVPLGLLVTALRPSSSYVNAATSQAGPNDDDDTLAIDLEYAAAAGHIELWRIAPARLLPGAQVGLQPSRKDVASEFTKLSLTRIGRKPRSVQFAEPVGFPSGNPIQVGY
jgi:hypothetical protein